MSRQIPKKFKEAQHSLSWSRLLLFFLGGSSLFISILIVFLFLAVWIPAKKFISEKPFEIDYIPTSEMEEELVSKKLKTFFLETVDNSSDTLSFDGIEFNHLVNVSPLVKDYKVKYLITLGDSTFNLRCVAPLASVRNQMVSIVRFLNIDGYLNAELEGLFKIKGKKILMVSIYSQMNGLPAPFALLGGRTNVDILKYFPNRFLYDKNRKELKEIFIRNKKVYVVRQ